MLTKIIFFTNILLMSQIISCETASVNALDQISGDWKLTKIFLSDAYDSPCGWETGQHRDITLNIKQENDKFTFSGQSTVNMYNGSFKATGDTTLEIVMGGVASTKMAGPENLMNCEMRYFNFLNDAKELQINNEGQLLIGNFKKPDGHPRDGGTYLVFEKAKK